MGKPRLTASLTAASLAGLLILADTAAAVTYRTVALTGEQVPGAEPGVVFSGLGTPVLNGAGQTAFLAGLTGAGVDATNDQGLWSEGTGSLTLVARIGDPAPGAGPGVLFGGFKSPLLNGAGQTAFTGFLTGAGVDATNNSSIYREGGGTLAQVARAGQQAPGAEPGVVFGGLNESLVFNATGQTAFNATLTGAGVDATNNSGIYGEGSGTLAQIAREGQQAPEAGPGVVFSSNFSSNLMLNSAGQTAFKVSLTGAGVDSTNNSGIWSGSAGMLALVAREGDAAPGTEPGAVFGNLSIGSPALNTSGQIAFTADLTGAGLDISSRSSIYRSDGGTLTQLVRAGQQAPGADPGVLFGAFRDPALNGAGQTAFSAFLTGVGVVGSNDRGIYATDFDGQLVEIARAGDLFDVNGDPLIKDLRTISDLSVVAGSGNEDGRRSAFNDLGQLAFAATFTDGTSGVFVANITSLPDGLGVVNIDFEAGVPSDTTHVGADGILSTTGTVWNSVTVGVNASGLTDEFGNATALGVIYTFSLPGNTVGDVDPASTNNLQDSGVQVADLQITGLLPGETYEIAGYVEDFGGFSVEDATGDLGFKGFGSPTYNLPGIETFPFPGTQRGDYIRLTDLIPADLGNGVFGITISTDGALTGLQIRGVIPEPIVLPGDLDGDGFVGIADLNLVLGNWNQSVPPGDSLSGEASGDGFVGIEDLNAVLGNWNAGAPAPGSAVPEPASLGMLLVGSCSLPRRWRRVA